MFQNLTNTCLPSSCAGAGGDVQDLTRKATKLLLLKVTLLVIYLLK